MTKHNSDEIEKGFAGSSAAGGSLDSGVGARVLGTFLTWIDKDMMLLIMDYSPAME